VITVDVPNGTELTNFLQRKDLELAGVLLTHTHHDHVNGLVDVVEQTGCVFFSAEPFGNLPRHHVTDGMSWDIEGLQITAWETSGHSDSDFSFLFPDLDLCFCGDTLFAWGCGRMFAGPPERLWNSLLRLRSLPDQTLICCGHDFRADNLRFLEQELAGVPSADQAIHDLREQLAANTFPGPCCIGDQKTTNPFLRADDPELARAVGRAGAPPHEVFAELRARRNRY
jgi:hydroxyacylglutathione hydrolase